MQSKFPTLTDDISSDLFVGYGQTQLHALYLGAPAAAKSLLANAGLGVSRADDAAVALHEDTCVVSATLSRWASQH